MLFVETIQILNGRIMRIHLHNERCNRTRSSMFGCTDNINLSDNIKLPTTLQNGRIKCRIVYNRRVQQVFYEPYVIRKIQSIQSVRDDLIQYHHKSVERRPLDCLYALRNTHDEILIVKNDHITDAYYYNVAFRKEGEWYTPRTPLLEGVMRQHLLDHGIINELNIFFKDLHEFDQLCLFNAMTDFGSILLDMDRIYT